MGILTQISRCVQLGDRLLGDPTFRTRAEIFAGQEKKLGYKKYINGVSVDRAIGCLPTVSGKGKDMLVHCFFLSFHFWYNFLFLFFFSG